MTTEECTAYIKNYFDNKTMAGSAIMLTSSWGRGKSYYIENELIEGLGRENCVKVSLYGMKSLDDISKALYLEIRALQWLRKSTLGRKVALFGRTVMRGLFSYLKLNLTPKENELQEIYKSANLEGKLIIFEDVERSAIPIVDVMGYVNNLCEQDHVKVLLVVNEEEIKGGVEAEAYRRIKEKTVSDTIIFACPIENPIKNILTNFQNVDSNVGALFEGIDVEEICAIMRDDARGHEVNGYNFRSLIFACQKTQDLFGLVKDNGIEFVPEFFNECLYSIIAFSLKFKRGEDQNGQLPLWTSDMDSPGTLGHIKHPLLKDCYNFIVEQKFDPTGFSMTVSDYPRLKQKDANWRKLNGYERYPFRDLIVAIDGIHALIRTGKFPLADFGTLISKLYSIKAAIGDIKEINELLTCIKDQLRNANFSPSALYDKIVTAFSTGGLAELRQEYEAYKHEIAEIIVKKAIDELIALMGQMDGISQFQKAIDAYESASKDLFNSLRPELTSRLDVEVLVENLVKCSPNIVRSFSEGFCSIYERGSIHADAGKVRVNPQGETISKLYDALPRHFKEGTVDTYLSLDDKETIKNFKEAIERQYAGIMAEKVYLEGKENQVIVGLIKCLEEKCEKPNVDQITKYQLSCFVDKLKMWINHNE